MNKRAVHFAQEHSGLTGSTLAVFVELIKYASWEGCNAFPSKNRLEQDTGLSRSTVQRQLRILKTTGEIEVERTYPLSSNRGRFVNVYRFPKYRQWLMEEREPMNFRRGLEGIKGQAVTPDNRNIKRVVEQESISLDNEVDNSVGGHIYPFSVGGQPVDLERLRGPAVGGHDKALPVGGHPPVEMSKFDRLCLEAKVRAYGTDEPDHGSPPPGTDIYGGVVPASDGCGRISYRNGKRVFND